MYLTYIEITERYTGGVLLILPEEYYHEVKEYCLQKKKNVALNMIIFGKYYSK